MNLRSTRDNVAGGRLWRRLVPIAAMAFAALRSQAATPLDSVDTWTDAGLAGWLGGTGDMQLSNPGGYMNMRFKSQSAPSLVSCTARKPLAAVYITNISFRIRASDQPSGLRLYMHSSRSGNAWYMSITGPVTGAWNEVSVPVRYDARWTTGPLASRQQFVNDVLGVDWVGVYVRRAGACNTQDYDVDDFRIQGVAIPASVNLSGVVYYDGDQQGPILVRAAPLTAGAAVDTMIPTPGSYVLSGLPPLTDYVVSAYRDSNTNAAQDTWEAAGIGTPQPVSARFDDVDSVAVSLADPLAEDGLPLWWVGRYFGLPISGGGTGGTGMTAAAEDADGDGTSNYGEYLAGTDPLDESSVFTIDAAVTNAESSGAFTLQWPSVAGRMYSVWRTPELLLPFARIASNLPATPPVNTFTDADTAEQGHYFYRVEIVKP